MFLEDRILWLRRTLAIGPQEVEVSRTWPDNVLLQPLEKIRSSISRIFPCAQNGQSAVDFSRRNWWMPPGPAANLPTWLPFHSNLDSSTEPGERSSDHLAVREDGYDPIQQEVVENAAIPARISSLESMPVQRRFLSVHPERLPRTLKVAYAELREELLRVGTELTDDEERLALRRKVWAERFSAECVGGVARRDEQDEDSAWLSGRLVQLTLLPCLCGAGFVLYLALAYGMFPLVPASGG